MKRPPYTAAEKKIIEKYYRTVPIAEMVRILADAGYERTEGSVQTFAFRSGFGREKMQVTKYDRNSKLKDYYRIKQQQKWQNTR